MAVGGGSIPCFEGFQEAGLWLMTPAIPLRATNP